MENNKFINQIIKASIDGYLAGFGRIKNKKDFLKMKNALKKMVENFGFDKGLITKTLKNELINFSI